MISMLRGMPLMAAIGLAAASAAWAGEQAKSPPATSAAATSLSTAQRQLAGSQAEVTRLAQDLHRQESDSRRASERLRQQDRTIAELRKQLHALQARTTPGAP